MAYADLHCHSTASDGSDSPRRVVERAREAGLSVLSLTDHDTVAGVREAREAGEELGVVVIPGAELTCYIGKREIHVLAYGIDIEDTTLQEHCTKFQVARIERARLIGERLAAEGSPIEMDKVMAEADGGVVGRPHIARALIEAGHVSDFQEAFDRFLAEGRPANVPKLIISPEECVAVIRNAGGIAIMAHPALGDQFDLIPQVIAAGAVGIEVWHSVHDAEQTQRLQVIALDRGLAMSGGSDCHGRTKNCDPILGNYGLDRARWEKLERMLVRETSWEMIDNR